MNALLHSEALKLRSLRATWVGACVVVLGSGLIGVAQVLTRSPGSDAPSLAAVALAPAQLVWFLVIVLAVLASAGEFQHRTVRTTLLVSPVRWRVLSAKAGVAGAVGAALVALGAVVAVGAAVVAASATGAGVSAGGAAAWAAPVWSVGVGAVWGVLATGLGVLTRSTAAAIAAVLLWRFVGEAVLPVVTRSPGLARWTPSGAADALVGLGGPHLPVAGAAALLTAYAALLCAAAALLFVRSDPA